MREKEQESRERCHEVPVEASDVRRPFLSLGRYGEI